jgi:hypothetical protein
MILEMLKTLISPLAKAAEARAKDMGQQLARA